jgi:hypothetical protein
VVCDRDPLEGSLVVVVVVVVVVVAFSMLYLEFWRGNTCAAYVGTALPPKKNG